MSIGINTNYNGNLYTSGKGINSVSDYSKYLRNKYQCLTPGKNASVSVSAGLMRKAMSDEKTAGWLEKELATIPDAVEAAQRAAIGHGSKLISVSIEYGEDCTTMTTCGIFGETGTDSEIDKWLEKIKDKKQEEKSDEEVQKNVEEFYNHTKVVETYVNSDAKVASKTPDETVDMNGYVAKKSNFDTRI